MELYHVILTRSGRLSPNIFEVERLKVELASSHSSAGKLQRKLSVYEERVCDAPPDG